MNLYMLRTLHRYLTHSLFILFLIAFSKNEAYCCPKVANLIDYNCDGKIKIAITGDSIVRGIGDEVNDNEGGYVLRLQDYFPEITIENIGVPGYTSLKLYKAFRKRLLDEEDNITKRKTFGADIFIVDIGRNDYWQKESPRKTVQYIQKLIRFITREDRKKSGSTPLFFVATLIPTARKFQEPFVVTLNKLLLESSSIKFPVTPIFNRLSTKLLSDDGLHPNSAGYDKIAKVVAKFIILPVQRIMKLLRPDSNDNGVYDEFEDKPNVML
jgi:lysophospholipase L1-like esterase